MEIRVTKATSVKSLKDQFKREFDCSLMIYTGNKFADDSKKIHDLAKDDYKGGDLKLGARSRVGNVEDYFKESFGVKVQIKNSDGTKLADNSMTLTQAGRL